ncbi:single-stranded-DNA-specific exonuclease RecJ [Pedobacter sp.]|nr:single-stranded-DNA-specific exonuclease RecJ [Candidatus Saccharibacteria bacterium]
MLQLLLQSRGLSTKEDQVAFLDPSYSAFKHDAFLLPDMEKAVDRLVIAKQKKEHVVIYGDYDIDGLTATTVLLEALTAFGITVDAFIPNRFVEGYGLSKTAVETIANPPGGGGAQLIVTVDCGSLSHVEVARANELGVDVIVTDHHSVAETMPAAVATINPKRIDHTYPFIDLAGVGVAFKLVQALQTKLKGLDDGQEKWLLDLVALGTVCDVVTLVDENRANVRWGLEVMKKTRRPGLRALMAISGAKPSNLNARSLGFGLGPRLNASGRLETAQLSLDLLQETDSQKALELAQQLDTMNIARRTEQDRIFKEAIVKAEELTNDPVLIVSDPSWSHGIIGIVAAKLLERYHKPTFVLQELGEESKGSARSYGDFSAVAAIRATDKLLIKGGGHKLAAGVTIQTEKIGQWRQAVNAYYRTLALSGQAESLLARADVSLETFAGIDETLVRLIDRLEPFGNGNPQPIFRFEPVTVTNRRLMGDKSQHVKYSFADKTGKTFQAIAFNSSDRFTAEPGEMIVAWCEVSVNEWQGRRTVEGRLLRLENSV